MAEESLEVAFMDVHLDTVYIDPESNCTQDEDSLESFHWHNYAEYLPEDDALFDVMTNMFESKAYGWKSRARLLMKIQVQSDYLSRLKEELVTSVTKERKARKAYTRHIDPREGLRAYLESRSEEALQSLCVQHSVSYKSFMKDNDRTELIEALIDEMA